MQQNIGYDNFPSKLERIKEDNKISFFIKGFAILYWL